MEEARENHKREEIFSKAVKAGKRTYFFDVRSTRGNDFYITLTESKKRFQGEGKFQYEKHKIFLYKEDFEKFMDGLNETISKIGELKSNGYVAPNAELNHNVQAENSEKSKEFSNVEFDDLGS
jgi:DNA helicase HerA-like ATPase